MGVFVAKSKLKIETNAPCLMVGGTLPRHQIHEISLKKHSNDTSRLFSPFSQNRSRFDVEVQVEFEVQVQVEVEVEVQVEVQVEGEVHVEVQLEVQVQVEFEVRIEVQVQVSS
jgi:hypothetical protein